MIIYYQNYAL